jgi:methyl coenzyme M reductase beta subunit
MRSLVKEAIEADAEIDRTGEVYRAEDVHAWMARLAQGTVTDRPKPWRR